ncbi:uncharacterized protein LOC123674176 [Harmonia axyridis]|uniref:uncharacterized protein LOC123674176 n=1 Tax=Harmonia axyridis TaxID=115357 RepID=UPI001E274EC8|nr:uncharacterized protein LOC123674176 [Harmonia axyridis]
MAGIIINSKMMDALVQIQAIAVNKEEEARRERRKELRQLLKSHPVMTADHDSYKLRSSKWFNHSEISIVCSVFESGFIVEKRYETQQDIPNALGIALWDTGYEKSKDPSHLKIYGLNGETVQAFNLDEFWTIKTQIKISNSGDRFFATNSIELIITQIKQAEKMKFDRDEHFVCYCRYGKPKKSFDGWSLRSILEKLRTFYVRW